MPTALHSARPRSRSQVITNLRGTLLDELYAQEDAGSISLPCARELEQIEEQTVRDASVFDGGSVVRTRIGPAGRVVESLTVLTAMKREDRVAAVLYSVRVDGWVTVERTVQPGSGLWRLASHVTAEVL